MLATPGDRGGSWSSALVVSSMPVAAVVDDSSVSRARGTAGSAAPSDPSGEARRRVVCDVLPPTAVAPGTEAACAGLRRLFPDCGTTISEDDRGWSLSLPGSSAAEWTAPGAVAGAVVRRPLAVVCDDAAESALGLDVTAGLVVIRGSGSMALMLCIPSASAPALLLSDTAELEGIACIPLTEFILTAPG